MRPSRTDLGAVLTILAGGVVGVSSSFLLLSRSDDVPTPVPVIETSATFRFQKRMEKLPSVSREQGHFEAAMDRLAEARGGTPLLVRPMRVMPQGRRGLTPEEWRGRR